MRAGGSMLAVRRCAADIVRVIIFGIEGTGGASAALGTPRAGEGSRKVRSDIDPLLPRRSRVWPSGPLVDPAIELPIDELEPALRSILFVWTSLTDTGVVGRARNAAAAAADESDAFEAWFFRKAEAAAVAALALSVEVIKGCRESSQLLLSCDIDACHAHRAPDDAMRWLGALNKHDRARRRAKKNILDSKILFSFCSRTWSRVVGK